ncbi:hypothetical protein BD779DRAFT_1018482 [Infundibulicybe gibba]|nr:hypothetical protein BD779DRAFT_1018482 [Infundibulicybe gibba]
MDLNDDDNLNSPSRRRSRIEPLEKRASGRVINGCQRVASTNNGASKYEALSVPHVMFDFASANGNSFQNAASAPASKPAGAITEHVFEFQVFTQFIMAFSADPRNSALGGCTWLQANFYSGVEPLAIVNRIDSIPNIVFASNFINSAKLAVIGDQSGVGTTGLTQGFPRANGGASQPARKKVEQLIRGLGSFANYMNSNAARYKSTAQDIITILQGFDRRTASAASPPVAVQFFEFLQAHVANYPTNGQDFGESLAIKYNNKVAQNNIQCISINSGQMVIDFQQSYPFLNTPGLLPPRPLCFPDGSPGNIRLPQARITDNLNPTVSGAVADNANMKLNMALAGGQFYTPSPLPANGFTQPSCATIFELVPGAAPASPAFNLNCTSRELTLVNSGTTLGNCGFISHTDGSTNLFCGSSLTVLQSCAAAIGSSTGIVITTLAWAPR